MTLVSVITPSYNQQQYLEATIRSVLEQDHGEIEYMVVDGGSTDGSLEILKKYADRLAWWTSERDHGQAEAINKGLRRASGEIIGWVNSDDIYLPGAIRQAVEAFQRAPEAGLVYGDALSIDASGQVFNVMKAAQYGLKDLLSFQIICQPAVFIRKAVLDRVGYLDESYHMLLDHQLWIRMARQAPLIHIPSTLAAARFHKDAKNRSSAAQFSMETMRLLDWIEANPEFDPEKAQYQRRIRGGAYRLSAFYLTDAGQPSAALGAYGRSFAQSPSLALRDWKHILLAGLSLLGLQKLRRFYDQLRLRQTQNKVRKE